MPDRDLTKVECRTPTPGKAPTNIPAWKYQAVSDAILRLLKPLGKDGMAFMDLLDAVGPQLSAKDKADLGSISWHTTSVKLEMECRGDIERFKKDGRQFIRVTKT